MGQYKMSNFTLYNVFIINRFFIIYRFLINIFTAFTFQLDP
jgi:hypothetical protein